MKPVKLLAILAILLSLNSSRAESKDSLQLTLPETVFAVDGVEMSIYFDNVVLTKTPETYHFEVTCALGSVDQRRWSVVPKASEVGEHDLVITVSDSSGKQLAESRATLIVIPRDAGIGHDMRMLIIGDSLTHASLYPNEIARLLSQPSNPNWQMLGTHQPSSAAKGVVHEGYGGWTWQRFVSKYESNPDGTHRKRSSPFVYLGDNGKPQLHIERYLKEECGNLPPDVIIIMLGINDCFSAPANDPDERIDLMFRQADILIKAFRAAVPKATLGICLTTPPNSREEAFEANYKGRYSRWNWKQIQHRLVQRQIEHFGEMSDANVFLIPTQLNLDPINGYPINNGVHPNAVGYKQIGASIYAWLKWRLTKSMDQ